MERVSATITTADGVELMADRAVPGGAVLVPRHDRVRDPSSARGAIGRWAAATIGSPPGTAH